MALIVQKFGGTSVATINNLFNIAKKIIETKQAGHGVVVVVSAMGDETDRLISLAKSVTGAPEPREYARLLATGEQVASALLAIVLNHMGCAARSYIGADLPIITQDDYDKTRIVQVDVTRLEADLNDQIIPVIAGFQGISEQGEITLLGRGGSDTTATAIAASLNADECQIYTDVDGVYTADPNTLTEARCIQEMSFPLLLEFAHSGAKVMQHRAVAIAQKYQIPLRILSSFKTTSGTFVKNHTLETTKITGISSESDLVRIVISKISHDLLTQLLVCLSQLNIEMDLLMLQPNQVLSFILCQADYPKALATMAQFIQQEPTIALHSDEHLAKLSLLGAGLRSDATIMCQIMWALHEHKIEILALACCELKISIAIPQAHCTHGLRVLHQTFGLDE